MTKKRQKLVRKVKAFQEKMARDVKCRQQLRAAGLVMKSLEASYRLDNNPLYVWGALRYSHVRDLQRPQWVEDALTHWAQSIVDMIKFPPKDEVADKVGRKLGFGGGKNGRNPFKRAHVQQEAEDLMRIYAQLRWTGTTMTAAIAKIANSRGLTNSTITRRLQYLAELAGIELKNISPGNDLPALVLVMIGQTETAVNSVMEEGKLMQALTELANSESSPEL